ncbi:MAG: hypothetical protein JSS72_07525 [Armatimonadetes bacterium]|nr:hypothetical protein [Armatimonadota bacterium]
MAKPTETRTFRGQIGQALAGAMLLAADLPLYITAKENVRLRGVEINGLLRRDWLAMAVSSIPIAILFAVGVFAIVSALLKRVRVSSEGITLYGPLGTRQFHADWSELRLERSKRGWILISGDHKIRMPVVALQTDLWRMLAQNLPATAWPESTRKQPDFDPFQAQLLTMPGCFDSFLSPPVYGGLMLLAILILAGGTFENGEIGLVLAIGLFLLIVFSSRRPSSMVGTLLADKDSLEFLNGVKTQTVSWNKVILALDDRSEPSGFNRRGLHLITARGSYDIDGSIEQYDRLVRLASAALPEGAHVYL